MDFKVTIKEIRCEFPNKSTDIKITSGPLMVSLTAMGSDMDPYIFAGVEIWEGQLRVLVWDDINEEECSHIIPINTYVKEED